LDELRGYWQLFKQPFKGNEFLYRAFKFSWGAYAFSIRVFRGSGRRRKNFQQRSTSLQTDHYLAPSNPEPPAIHQQSHYEQKIYPFFLFTPADLDHFDFCPPDIHELTLVKQVSIEFSPETKQEYIKNKLPQGIEQCSKKRAIMSELGIYNAGNRTRGLVSARAREWKRVKDNQLNPAILIRRPKRRVKFQRDTNHVMLFLTTSEGETIPLNSVFLLAVGIMDPFRHVRSRKYACQFRMKHKTSRTAYCSDK
ncbi:hypothetical protein C0J52_00420, partial [Blattella germanica]